MQRRHPTPTRKTPEAVAQPRVSTTRRLGTGKTQEEIWQEDDAITAAAQSKVSDGSQKLQKVLAQAGLGSRRDMEELIKSGHVTVNGKVADLGMRVSEADNIRANGRTIKMRHPDHLPRMILYHKPEGEIVSRNDPEGRISVFDRIPTLRSSSWMAIGRLDFNTSGLLIFTTSGDLANSLTHPRFEVQREYAVRLIGELTPDQITRLKTGIELEDGPAKFDALTEQGGEGSNRWYHVMLKEGRNREVRRLFEAVGVMVSRLIRVRFGAINLPPRLKRGQWLELGSEDVVQILKWAGMPIPHWDSRHPDKERLRSTPRIATEDRPPKLTSPKAAPPKKPVRQAAGMK